MILLSRAPTRLSKGWARRRLGAASVTLVRAARGQLGPRGPDAVAGSLQRGLEAIGEPLEVNPRRVDGPGRAVGVLSDLDALAQAINWRRDGSVRRLIAGPNLVVLPSDARDLITAPEVDVCVVPSEWVKRLYEEDSPELRGRIAVWPAGVDPEHWAPVPQRKHERRALVYVKELAGQRNVLPRELRETEHALKGAGFQTVTLRYGSFSRAEYLRALQTAELMVFFSPSESQCIAQAEAWSTDVPTLIWAAGRWEYGGRVYATSSAPYLSPETGASFADAAAFTELIGRWDEVRRGFAPREWVLDNMTDVTAARAYLHLAGGSQP